MKRFTNFDNGNIILEFIAISVALLVPLCYIGLAALKIADSYIDIQNAARAGARIFATSRDEQFAKQRSISVVNSILNNSDGVQTSFSCTNDPCLSPAEIVTVTVRKDVSISLPAVFGNINVTLKGEQSEVVQDVW